MLSFFFVERLQTFNIFCLVDAKQVVGLHRQHDYKFAPTKNRIKEQKLVFFLLISEKKVVMRLWRKRKLVLNERKKLLFSCLREPKTCYLVFFRERKTWYFVIDFMPQKVGNAFWNPLLIRFVTTYFVTITNDSCINHFAFTVMHCNIMCSTGIFIYVTIWFIWRFMISTCITISIPICDI